MAKSKREKYKAANLAALKKKVDKEDSLIGYSGGSEFLEIVEGKSNKFRLLPAHKGVDYYVIRKRYWLTLEGDDGDNVRRTVLDSRIHGGTKKDLIDEYLKWCKDNVTDKDKIESVNHWSTGLKAENSFICYAVKISGDTKEFGLLNFKKTVRDAVNKATFVEDDDEPIEVDPFTDLDEGLPLIIRYNSKPNKKKGEDYYDVQVGKKSVAIGDEEFDLFDEAKPLTELYDNVYSLSNFETALEGLKWFDAEHEIDAFDEEEWIETIEEVKDQYEGGSDDSDEEEEEDEKPKRKKSKKKPEPEEDEDDSDEDEEDDSDSDSDDDDEEDEDDSDDDDGLDDLSRSELKSYIKVNDLEFRVKKSMDEDDIREGIRGEMNDDSDEGGTLSMDEIRNKLKKKG